MPESFITRTTVESKQSMAPTHPRLQASVPCSRGLSGRPLVGWMHGSRFWDSPKLNVSMLTCFILPRRGRGPIQLQLSRMV